MSESVTEKKVKNLILMSKNKKRRSPDRERERVGGGGLYELH